MDDKSQDQRVSDGEQDGALAKEFTRPASSHAETISGTTAASPRMQPNGNGGILNEPGTSTAATTTTAAATTTRTNGIRNEVEAGAEADGEEREERPRKKGVPMTRTISFSTPPAFSFPSGRRTGVRNRFGKRSMGRHDTDYSDDGSGASSVGDDTLSEMDDDTDNVSSSEGVTERRRTRFRPRLPQRIRRSRRRSQESETDDEKSVDKTAEGQLITERVYRRTPVFSGTIAPFSIMLEIPGFTSRWYVRTGNQAYYRPNPPVLDVGLALSLLFAVIANVSIIARFAERLPPRLATLIAVFGFVVHDVINIVALVVFAVIHDVDDGFTYSEAFWMTTAATAASLLCTTTLLLDYRNTHNFKSAGSGLTKKQSQLVMAIMAFLAYISISALIYSLVEQLQFLVAMYFMVETLATVGLGDVVPKSLAARILLFFVAPGGIVLLAVVIAFARQTILEELENAYKRNRALYKEKLAQRAQERRELNGVKHTLKRKFTRVGRGMTRQFTISNAASSDSGKLPPPPPRIERDKGEAEVQAKAGTGVPAEGRLFFEQSDDKPTPIYESPSGSCVDLSTATDAERTEETQQSAAETPNTFKRHDTMRSIATSDQQAMMEMEAELVAQRHEIDERFAHFALTLSKRERTEFLAKIGASALMFVGFWVVGAAVFSAIEGWTYFQGFYFSFVIFSSIGYGDLSPTTNAGRAFFIVWTLAGFGTLTVLLSILTDAGGDFFQKRRRVKNRKIRRKKRERPARSQREMEEGQADTEKQTNPGEDASPSSSPSMLKGKVPSSSVTSLPHQAPLNSAEANAEPPSLVNLTRTAMSMHRSALQMLKLDRHTLADAFRRFPDLVAPSHHHKHQQQEAFASDDQALMTRAKALTIEQRESVIKSIEETGDEKLVLIVRQWLLLAEFEGHLHTMFRQSTLLCSDNAASLSDAGDIDKSVQD